PTPTMPAVPSVRTVAPTALPTALPTPLSTSMSDSLVNAYGPDFEPGIGTPGVNEYNEPGYFRTDPKQLREGQQRIDSANESVIAADAAVAQARARMAEMPYDSEESAQLASAESVRAAEARADKARIDAADAITDYAETTKGNFTGAKKASKPGQSASQAGGGMGLGGLGSIASSFLEETFGFGSLLPALDSFFPLQAADTLLSAFMPTAGGGAADAAAGTSMSAFGIPEIGAPPMPVGGMHGGSGGAPGPAPQVINVDQSQNFNNSPVGSDPAAVEKARQSNINRAPRLPTGMGQ
ncbi:MAG: hypothetical protein WD072_09930, partial [Pirellulales bacterium]